jgi:hypothetical protein
MARHNKRDRERLSTSLKTLAPVVVNPETLSNTASERFGRTPASRKGAAPKKLVKIHARETRRNPSPALNRMGVFLPKKTARRAVVREREIGSIKARKETASWSAIAKMREGIMDRAMIPRRRDSILKRTRRFMMLRRKAVQSPLHCPFSK